MSYSAVATPVKVAMAASSNQQMVDVVAPATLAEGYQFQAISNGMPFTVTVPLGGVKEGQTFSVPFSPMDQKVVMAESTPMVGGIADGGDDLDAMPHGTWKDGLCDCFRFGICHPSLCNAIFCPLVLAGQVLTRFHRNWLSNPDESTYKKTTKIMLAITIAYYILSAILSPQQEQEIEVTPSGDFVVVDVGDPPPLWKVVLYHILGATFALFTFYTIIRVRRAVREKYRIPETNCVGLEDCCCAVWCGCCTVAQVARHTANYEQRRAICCSDTGLPKPTPVLVV